MPTSLKLDNISIQKAEILKTYYAAEQQGPVETKPALKTKDRILFLISVVVLLSAAGGLFAWHYFSDEKNISLSSFKNSAGIAYHNYNDANSSMPTTTLGQGYETVFAINFGAEKDFTDTIISFTAKGKKGAEKIAVILKDRNNFSNANYDDKILTPSLLGGRWQTFRINMQQLSLPLDKSRITQLRFDASDKLTGNNPDAIVYIKNITIKNTKKENIR